MMSSAKSQPLAAFVRWFLKLSRRRVVSSGWRSSKYHNNLLFNHLTSQASLSIIGWISRQSFVFERCCTKATFANGIWRGMSAPSDKWHAIKAKTPMHSMCPLILSNSHATDDSLTVKVHELGRGTAIDFFLVFTLVAFASGNTLFWVEKFTSKETLNVKGDGQLMQL